MQCRMVVKCNRKNQTALLVGLTTMHDFPVIDISPLRHQARHDRPGVVEALAAACHDTGFMVIAGHGIPAAAIRNLREAVISFFARPLIEKLALSVTKDNYRGYIPFSFLRRTPQGTRRTTMKATNCMPRSARRIRCVRNVGFTAPNKWPDAPPDLQRHVQAYWQHCDQCLRRASGGACRCADH